MKQEDKELLLKDLSSRLPYGIKIELTWWVMGEGTCINTTLEPDQIEQLLNDKDGNTEIKPYLRPMSSMTEEEKKEISVLLNYEFYIDDDYALVAEDDRHRIRLDLIQVYIDWLNANMFDYRGLIPKDLAIEVTEENNPYKE